MNKRYRLLFVDNEEKLLRSFNAVFRRDYDVYFAADEFDALEILSQQPIDIIVSDDCLSSMSGVELLALVHKQYSSIVLFLLADKRCLRFPADHNKLFHRIDKPCSIPDVKRVVRNVITETIEASSFVLRAGINKGKDIAGMQRCENNLIGIKSDMNMLAEAGSVFDSLVVSKLPVVKLPSSKYVSSTRLHPVKMWQQPVFLDSVQNSPEQKGFAEENSVKKCSVQKVQILMFDKSQRMRNSIKVLSKCFGFGVYGAASYEQAINMFLLMPEVGVMVINLTEGVRELTAILNLFKQYCPYLSVIAFADANVASSAIQLISEGLVFRCVQKPVNPVEFRHAIIAGFKRYRMLKKMTCQQSLICASQHEGECISTASAAAVM